MLLALWTLSTRADPFRVHFKLQCVRSEVVAVLTQQKNLVLSHQQAVERGDYTPYTVFGSDPGNLGCLKARQLH